METSACPNRPRPSPCTPSAPAVVPEAKAYLDDKRVKYTYIDFDLAEKDVQDHIQDEMVAHNAAAFPSRGSRGLHRGLQPGGVRAVLKLE